jgi:phage terminase large subunit-like protein
MSSEDDGLDPYRILRNARKIMTAAEINKKFNKLDFWGPVQWYDKQLEHFQKGSKVHQRIILGANQSGKSLCCAYETAAHITGRYGDWWPGRRYTGPVDWWVAGPSLSLVRQGAQMKLFGWGGVGELGTGFVPLNCIAARPVSIPGGGGNFDIVSVWHHNAAGERDGQSTVSFKSFEMGEEKLSVATLHGIWIDERCSEDIYGELLARTTATDGIVYLSYTPLKAAARSPTGLSTSQTKIAQSPRSTLPTPSTSAQSVRTCWPISIKSTRGTRGYTAYRSRESAASFPSPSAILSGHLIPTPM